MKKEYVISRDDSIYEAFPDMAMNADGELICIFLECEHHLKRENVCLAITRSRDSGKTWDKKEVFWQRCDEKVFTFNCPRISRLPDDTMVIICDAVTAKYWETDDKTDTAYQYVWRSTDGGKTWGEPEIINVWGMLPDKYQVLSNGRHIFGLHHLGKSGKHEQYACYSDDNGKTWNKVLIAADERYSLCEVSIVEVKPGVLVAFMRENSFTGIDCKKAISHDYGTTWEGVYDTNIGGCHRPVVGFYDEGKLLMTYRYLPGGKGEIGSWTQNLFGAFFDVDTALATDIKDQLIRVFPIGYDRSTKSDTGYSGWVRFDDGGFYVVNYLLDDAPRAQIRGYSFNLEDVYIESKE